MPIYLVQRPHLRQDHPILLEAEESLPLVSLSKIQFLEAFSHQVQSRGSNYSDRALLEEGMFYFQMMDLVLEDGAIAVAGWQIQQQANRPKIAKYPL